MSIKRKTKTVRLLLESFKHENIALSVVELVSLFGNDMNKTTVYRILQRLEDSGILHSFIDNNGLKRYAKSNQNKLLPTDSNMHAHFLCEMCGISNCLEIEITPPNIPNYVINSSEQLFIGHCKDCIS